MSISWIIFYADQEQAAVGGRGSLLGLTYDEKRGWLHDEEPISSIEARFGLRDEGRLELMIPPRVELGPIFRDDEALSPDPALLVFAPESGRVFLSGYPLRKFGQTRLSFGGPWAANGGSMPASDQVLRVLVRREGE